VLNADLNPLEAIIKFSRWRFLRLPDRDISHMLRMLSQAANARRSVSRSRTVSGRSTPYDTPFTDDESFSSFSESENERPRRRKAVGGKAAKENSKQKASNSKKTSAKSTTGNAKADVDAVDKKPTNKRKLKTQPPPDELVHIAKKEGSTKFQQMRKFLERANEAEKPTDILSGFLSKRRSSAGSPLKPLVLLPNTSEGSPISGLSSLTMSPRIAEFHTGLTPTNKSSSPPAFRFFPGTSRRDSDDGFAASDLLAGNGETATNKIGSFIHGQRGLNLRRKMNSKQALVAGASDSTTALLMEEIPDMEKRLQKTGQKEIERRVLINSAENEDEENMVMESSMLHEDDDLNDSQVAFMGM